MDADMNLKRVGSRREATRAFTLIEVLVVVAIIALLISVLLPSLKRARDQARALVCAANLNSTCKSENAYQLANREYIPGSPWTTGYYCLTAPSASAWLPALSTFDRFTLNMFDYATPLRAFTLGRAAISTKPSALFKGLSSESYCCPCNKEIATPYPLAGGPYGTLSPMPAISMMTMTTMMCAGPAKYNAVSSNPSAYPGAAMAGHVAQSDSWTLRVPSAYFPRHTRIGRDSLKVFVADGARYYDAGNFTFTTNRNKEAKMTSCATPPSTGGVAAFDLGREYNLARAYSYRHGANNQIEAGFFDGHVEKLSLGPDRDAQTFTGRVVHPQYYYPSGTVVADVSQLHMDSLPVGTVLP